MSSEFSGSMIGAIDQGTSSTRFIVFDVNGHIVAKHQQELTQHSPQPGWVEQDPLEIMDTVRVCIEAVAKQVDPKKIRAIGITNQRETTVVWDPRSGKPLHRAIVWLDVRCADICRRLEKKTGSRDYFRPSCGLPISTYFSAMKLRWLIENCDEVKKAVEDRTCMFGTIETWLIWNLTGGINGGQHITDVSNASRTMLMNLNTLWWDSSTCDYLKIPVSILPDIRSNSEVYGSVAAGILRGIPIAGCLGDQQAALVGQLCFSQGEAKNTYGTGIFLLMSTGDRLVQSKSGLITTVCAQLGPTKRCMYALEGSIASGGVVVKWLRDNLNFFETSAQINELAQSVPDNGGVFFVPALSGLLAPHWRDDARGLIVGLTHFSTKAHIARAALEAVAFSTRDVIDAMEKDSGVKLVSLRVDGGMAASDLLLQIQANIIGKNTVRPSELEATALGAAIAAGLATGLWQTLDVVRKHLSQKITIFQPTKEGVQKAEAEYVLWKRAIDRSIGWVQPAEAPTSVREKLFRVARRSALPVIVAIAIGIVILAWVKRVPANDSVIPRK